MLVVVAEAVITGVLVVLEAMVELAVVVMVVLVVLQLGMEQMVLQILAEAEAVVLVKQT